MKEGWEIKRRITRKYDALASVYDELYQEEQNAKIKSALKNIQLRKSDRILDVGCGTGILFNHVKDQVALLVGLDISKNLLKRALFKSRGSLNVALILADADYMPFINGSFDKIFAVTLLQNLPDIAVTLKEINRVSRKDALITITGLKKAFKKREFSRILDEGNLQVLNLEAGSHLLGYVAVCRKK